MNHTIRRTIGFLGIALMSTQLFGAAVNALPTGQRSSLAFEQAAPVTPDQKKADRLLRQVSLNAVAVSSHADRLESLTHGARLQRHTHASELMRAKDAINAMGSDFAKLQALRERALPWQQALIDRLQPVLAGLAGDANEAIELLNAERRPVASAEYRDAIRNLYADAGDARNMVAVNLEYAQAREKLNRLDAWAPAGVTTEAAVLPTRDRAVKSLDERVQSELLKLPYYGVFDHLTFQREGGRVILGGDVTRPVLKADAESAVARIEGVAAVVNRINVLPLSSFDDSLRITAYRAIYGHMALAPYGLNPQKPIRIIVENGHVTLKGVVRTDLDRSIAYMQASGIRGAFSVTSELRLGS